MADDPRAGAARTYQIGTVSSLTGVDAHTIRAWERRYGAIKPMRNHSGRRLYDDESVERLQLLKGLVDCHEAIGSIAHLSDEDLRMRLEKLAHLEVQAARTGTEALEIDQKARLALLAPSLAAQLGAHAGSLSDFEIRISEDEPEHFLEGLRELPCEIAVLELDTLNSSALATVRAAREMPGRPQIVVLYRFANRVALARLARAGATLVPTPIRLDSLRRLIHDQMIIRLARSRRGETQNGVRSQEAATGTEVLAPAAELVPIPRRFDDTQLARLFELTSAVDCECPNHLSSLVSGLVSFEQYSRDCESRNEEDAAQHRRLAAGTGVARAAMERLLAELCEHEGISI